MLALISALLVVCQGTVVQIGSFNDLEAQTTSKCISGAIPDNLTLELTADIEVEDTVRIPKAKDMVIRSQIGEFFKIKPKSNMKKALMTIGGLWCLQGLDKTYQNLRFEHIGFGGHPDIDGTLEPAAVHVGDLKSDSDVHFDRVHFTNIKRGSGTSAAALALKKGNVTMTNCTFEGNENAGNYGGALNVGKRATVLIEDTTFKANKGGGMGGGAIHLGSGGFTCNRCVFEGNEATDNNGKGDAIFGDSSDGDGTISGWSVAFNECNFKSGQKVHWKDQPETKTWTCAATGETVQFPSGVPTCQAPAATSPSGGSGGVASEAAAMATPWIAALVLAMTAV